jgi:2-polyprenyl-6-methoxyphenol hydroxylase-like FAD-dependent oxidoreductase
MMSPAGRRTIAARMVVGADGMHSVVREAAAIRFSGAVYAGSFILADVALDGHPRDEVRLYFSPAGLVVVAPLPGGTFRIVATVADAPEQPGMADVQALLDARGPTQPPARVTALAWSSRFRLHHRLAERYRNGRFLLVGDAAHVHSPAGGQGMNTGLVDACVLGRILAAVISGRRDAAFLDEYERLRRPAAAAVLRLAGRLTTAATLTNRPQRAMRNLALSLAGRVPALRRRIAMDLSGLSRRGLAVLDA